MCHKLDLKQALDVFGLSNSDELHSLKEVLRHEFSKLLKINEIGENPDLAWCGKSDRKMLCFKSRRVVGKEKCTSILISDIIYE